MSSFSKLIVAVAAGFAIFVSASSANALSLPGIPASGNPAFVTNSSVSLNPNSGKLSVKGKFDFLYDLEGTMYNGTHASWDLKADFDSSGNLVGTGSLTFNGVISDLGIVQGDNQKDFIMSADIIGMNLTSNSSVWGFETSNLICNVKLLATCTTNESIYVVLDKSFNGDFTNALFKTTGFAVTTVPVPAAAWLFGSALGLLGWVRSRAKSAAAA
jgi:hypothetical protein